MKQNVSFSIQKETLNEFNEKCFKEGFNRSRVIEIMIKSFLELDK